MNALRATGWFLGAASALAVVGCTAQTAGPPDEIVLRQSALNTNVTVTVNNSSGVAQSGKTVYVQKKPSSTFMSSGTTNAQGHVTFSLAAAQYRFATPGSGNSFYFYSGAVGSCTTPSCTSATITTTDPITVTVLDTDGHPQTGADLFAENTSGVDVASATVDQNGHAVISVNAGSYRFSTPGLPGGFNFYSGASGSCTVPGCTTASITVQKPVALTLIDGFGNPVAGEEIDAIDSAGNRDNLGGTDSQGHVTISVDPGTYQFKVVYHNAYFLSAACAVPGCTAATVQIQKPVLVSVTDGYGTALPGQTVTAFDSAGNQSAWETSDSTGVATLYMPPGAYFFRVIAGGSYFDSGPSGSCSIPGCTSASIAVTDVVVTVTDSNGNPMSSQNVTAYATDGSQAATGVTDAQGHAPVFVPAGAYKFRIVLNSDYFESGPDGHCVVPGCRTASISLSAPLVVTVVDGSGNPVANQQVVAHASTSGQSQTQTTDSQGHASFTLPPDGWRFTGTCGADTFVSGDPGSCVVPGCTTAHITMICGACTGKPDGTACNDGDACTQTDSCHSGACVGSNPITCTASDQCHSVGMCDPASGVCSNLQKANGASCSDGNACTQTDSCQSGTCTGSNPVTCTAQDQCHTAGTCNTSTGVCSNPNKANGTTCDDGNACTTADACQSGTCTGNAVTCTAQDQCHTAGTCNTSTGVCSNPNKANGTTCDDGNACTTADACQSGTCTGNAVTCTAQDQCHAAGTCNTSTGVCSNPNKANGTTCDDGNACTQTDSCQSGSCTGSNAVTCTAQDQCHTAGSCNTATGVCSNPTKANGTACDDGNACTVADACQSGSCSGNAVTCTAQDQCHTAGTCNTSTGACSNPTKSDGSSCDDGNSCTSGDNCVTGTCTGAPIQVCGLNAPPLDRTVATNVASATAFLYSGTNPIQTGVAVGTIDPLRAAVIRGLVTEASGAPVPGVRASIHGHPEFGETLTRADGLFDLAVNGGGILNLDYDLAGRLPVQRQIVVPRRDFIWAPDVALLPIDSQMTVVDLPTGDVMQVAQGSVVTDVDGTRQATLFIPGNTTASMVLADGTIEPLSQMRVHATEYTVGSAGPRAMPGLLPLSSGYTYAIEYSVEEAIATGATSVQFNQPLIHYVDNFIGFPVGGIVPVGFYDRDKGAWVPSDNGRVVKVVDVLAGLAELDTDGDNLPDDASTLSALGITDSERAQLALLYVPGSTLWRSSISHFSACDDNWPFSPPPGAGPPDDPAPEADDNPDPDPCEQTGSIIQCENQVLGEALPIVGAPFQLEYSSDRTQGFRPQSGLTIPVTGPTVPTGIKRVEAEVQIGGQRISFPVTTAPNQVVHFQWDGNDAYGRPMQGPQQARVVVRWVFPTNYATPPVTARSFGLPSNVALDQNRQALEVSFPQGSSVTLGGWDAAALDSFGGWEASVHHSYSPDSRQLTLGSGRRVDAQSLASVITRIAGSRVNQASGDGGPAATAGLNNASSIAVAPDGTLYFWDFFLLRKISPDGIINTVAGGGFRPGNAIVGFPATEWNGFGVSGGLTVAPDGSLYFSTFGGIMRVGPDGLVALVAGRPDLQTGFSGDGGPATEAFMKEPNNIRLTGDGTLYFLDLGNTRIRRITPDGIIDSVAGNGTIQSPPDGVPAVSAPIGFDAPYGMDVGTDGVIYFVDVLRSGAIRSIGSDGILHTVAGSTTDGPFSCPLPADGPALSGAINAAQIAVASDNSIYFATDCGPQAPFATGLIRKVGTDGRLYTLAGAYQQLVAASGASDVTVARRFPVGVRGMAIGDHDTLFFTGLNAGNLAARDSFGNYDQPSYNFIYKVSGGLPGVAALDEIAVAAPDSTEVYVFNEQGRHLRTVDFMTDAVKFVFNYTPGGLVSGIADANGLVTAIERDSTGNPTAIVSSTGQRTTLSVGLDGYLSQVASPAGGTFNFGYTADGLLSTETDSRGGAHLFAYDSEGRLTSDQGPGGTSKTLVRTGTPGSYGVAISTAEGRVESHNVQNTAAGRSKNVTGPDGISSQRSVDPSGVDTSVSTDGTTSVNTPGPDPRFGMAAAYLSTRTIRTPAGLAFSKSTTRVASSPNGTALASQIEFTTINGHTMRTVYNGTTRTTTITSMGGRQSVIQEDQQGRVLSSQLGTLALSSYSYDARGRLTSIAEGSGAGSRATSFGYDEFDRQVTETNPLQLTTSWGYDADSHVTSYATPDGAQTTVTVNTAGDVLSVAPPGKPAHQLTYTAAGDQATYTFPASDIANPTTGYSYNHDRQLTLVTRPDGRTVGYTYDSAGRLSTTSYDAGTVTRIYSPTTGQLINVAATDGGTLDYVYDGELLLSATWSGPVSGVVSRSWNNDFRIATESVNGGSTIAVTYDPDGLIIHAGALTVTRDPGSGLVTGTTLGGLTGTVAYDQFGGQIGYAASVSGTPLFQTGDTPDNIGRLSARTETIAGVTHAYIYEYDDAGHLRTVTTDGALTATYSYDQNGNRLSKTGSGNTEAGAYDTQDRLLTYATFSYSYTTNGELASKTNTMTGQVTTYSYDALGNLRAVGLPDGREVEYLIDGVNRRIGKKINGSMVRMWLYRDGLRPVAELDGTGTLRAQFVYGSSDRAPDYMIASGKVYGFVNDKQGTARLVVDTSTGAVVERVDVDEFGRVSADSSPGFQPFGFAGGIYDADTGLVRFGARDYDPICGRWTTKDPIRFRGGQGNLYVYVNNDPLNRRDPKGLCHPPNEVYPGVVVNGCGPQNANICVPDIIGNTDFGPACDNHDFGYSMCGRPKADVDANFLSEMLSACVSSATVVSVATGFYSSCVNAAFAYYSAVKGGGKNAYDDAQRSACARNPKSMCPAEPDAPESIQPPYAPPD